MGCGCGSSSNNGVNKDSHCCSEGEFEFTSGIKYDGDKFVCGNDVYARECDSLNDILTTLFGKICNFDRQVLYAIDALSITAGGNPAVTLNSTSYTVPLNGAGKFEVLYQVNGFLPQNAGAPFAELQLILFKNGLQFNAITNRIAKNETTFDNMYVPMTLFVSEIVLAEGDVLSVGGFRDGGAQFSNGVIKIIKKAN